LTDILYSDMLVDGSLPL